MKEKKAKSIGQKNKYHSYYHRNNYEKSEYWFFKNKNSVNPMVQNKFPNNDNMCTCSLVVQDVTISVKC